MILWVSGVVQVTPQSTCACVIAAVMNENGTGASSPGWVSSRSQAMVLPSSRAGVPVFNRPMGRPRA